MRRMHLAVVLAAVLLVGIIAAGVPSEKPLVLWYVVVKHLDQDFLQKAELYKPDMVLLTVYAEDDLNPLNGSRGFDLKGTVDGLHRLGVKVYYSFSLFSRSALPYEKYMEQQERGTPLSEQNIHVADYARHLRLNERAEYERVFGPWLETGLDPEAVPRVERKPVDGFYVEPGYYTSIDPAFGPYRDYLKRVISSMINTSSPDGLAFDHGRFFTFDSGYNQDISDWILNDSGFDIYNYTPKPPFQLGVNWSVEDRLYYDGRAKLVSYAVGDIYSGFREYPLLVTTMGMIDAARANGQYVEMQVAKADGLLLMEYGDNPYVVEKNVADTAGIIGASNLILGIFPFEDREKALQNINIGLRHGVKGFYLLGYRFPDSVHEYLLKVRELEPGNPL